MSTLLRTAPKDATGGILAVSGSSPPDYFANALPYEASELAVDDSGAVDHYHQGLPFTAQSRLAITPNTPTYYGSGGAPFDGGRLCMFDGTPAYVSGGVAYDASGPLSSVGVDPNGVRITSQPADWTDFEGENAVFSVTATSGDASPLSYQWQEYTGTWNNLANGGRVSGATTATLTISNAVLADSGRIFRCEVSNLAPSTRYSGSASMTVLFAGVTITAEPVNWSGDEGQNATFSVTATSGDASALSYQWQEFTTGWADLTDGGQISGATTSGLTVGSAILADDGRQFRCRVTNLAPDTEFTTTVTMSVSPATDPGVTITVNPSNWSGIEGQNATFSVTATSGDASPLSYQWQEFSGTWGNLANGGRISGATTSTLTVSTAILADDGRQFRCSVSNLAPDTEVSTSATMSVSPAVDPNNLDTIAGVNLDTIAGANLTRIP